GDTRLENTHPFVRELWGDYWSFAHNGDLVNFSPKLDGRYRPVGTTDSEKAFCYILQELTRAHGDRKPTMQTITLKIRELTMRLAHYGNFNFLLSNGEFMFAHCSTKLSSIVRKSPFKVAHLKDQDVAVDFNEVTTTKDRVAVI